MDWHPDCSVFGRLALLCALMALIAASIWTASPQVILAQQVAATSTATTATATRSTATPSTSPTQAANLTPTLVPLVSAAPQPVSAAAEAAPGPPSAAALLGATPTASPTVVAASPSPTATPPPSSTATPTASPNVAASPSATPVRVLGVLFTQSPTRSPTSTNSPSPTTTQTLTPTPSPTPTRTLVPTATTTSTATATAIPPVAPQSLGVSASSITRSSATITWTTDLPGTSQVAFGSGASELSRSTVDASLLTSHRQVLTGLTPGTTYSYRVRSVSAGGALGISTEFAFVTAPAGSGPEIGGVNVRQVTSSTLALAWATSTGNVAQVEYGTTSNYGLFTLLKVFAAPAQEMVLTSLRPATDYHVRIKAWDAEGNLGSSEDVVFTTAPAGAAVLLGAQIVQPERTALAGGQAVAYQYLASRSGQANLVRLYVDAGTTARVVRVAVYADVGGTPGAILSQGSASGLSPGWINVNIPPIAMIHNRTYWIGVLSPIGGGTVNVRDAGSGGSSLLSRQTTLAALPTTWSAGLASARSPLSVSVEQVPPAVTLTGLKDGAIVTGSVVLSAVVDDDTAIALVEFAVDGAPVGPPLIAAPYTVTWDSSRSNASQPHTITARATDRAGRSSVSQSVDVQVDNGPTISDIAVSAGLTASSARIGWTTNILADAQVEYGPTSAYGYTTPVDPRPDWRHEAQLTALLPGTTYHFRIKSRDANGALGTTPDHTFATSEP